MKMPSFAGSPGKGPTANCRMRPPGAEVSRHLDPGRPAAAQELVERVPVPERDQGYLDSPAVVEAKALAPDHAPGLQPLRRLPGHLARHALPAAPLVLDAQQELVRESAPDRLSGVHVGEPALGPGAIRPRANARRPSREGRTVRRGRRARPRDRSGTCERPRCRRTRCGSGRSGRCPCPCGGRLRGASSPRAERTAQRRMAPSSGTTSVRSASAVWMTVQPGDSARGGRPRQSRAPPGSARSLPSPCSMGQRRRRRGRRIALVTVGQDGDRAGRDHRAGDSRPSQPSRGAARRPLRRRGERKRLHRGLLEGGCARRRWRAECAPSVTLERCGDLSHQHRGAVRSRGRILRERPLEDRVERGRKLGPPRAGARRRLARVREEDGRLGLPRIYHGSGEALEGHGGEAVAVGRRGSLGAADDLRGQVGDRPDELAGGGHAGRSPQPREPEVAQVGVVGRADEHVLRLHVAMDETRRVRGVEGVGHLGQERQRSGSRRARARASARRASAPAPAAWPGRGRAQTRPPRRR